MRKPSAHNIGYAFIAMLWAFLFLLVFSLFLEYGGGIRIYQHIRYGDKEEHHRQSFYQFLSAQYDPFTVQHLHPLSLFSFPLQPKERLRISNETVHLGAHGFRGPGPEQRGDRGLAFLIGGSTAFGHFATSDETTIVGSLNAKQKQYHFVNAGVPSWNTTQELHRLVDELLSYRPALIVAFHGSNEVAIALDYARKGKTYPAGAPESFDLLHELVDDIRGVKKSEPLPLYKRAFPELTRHMHNALGMAPKLVRYGLSETDLDRMAEQTAEHYLRNVDVMERVSQAFGAHFFAILQPVADLHGNIAFVPNENANRQELYRQFRENILGAAGALPVIDLSSFFDMKLDSIPVFDPAMGDLDPREHIFVDHVHVTDRGNALIADEMILLLRERGMLSE